MADMARHVPAIVQAMQTIPPPALNRVGGRRHRQAQGPLEIV
jgi:hypothetical protein